jgi:biofilm PGA synthesis lipoprotein PgaB
MWKKAAFLLLAIIAVYVSCAKLSSDGVSYGQTQPVADTEALPAAAAVSTVSLPPVKTEPVYYTNQCVVLAYHHISSEMKSSVTITPERFESDLKMLKDKGFRVIPLRKLVEALNGQYGLPANAVAITFDDGLESYYTEAYPPLLEYGYPSVNFVITQDVEVKTPPGTVPHMNMDQIWEIYSSGLVDIQSHTHNSHGKVYINPKLDLGGAISHRIYNPKNRLYESNRQYAKRVATDLKKSSDLIERYVGKRPDILCFPYGDYTGELINLAKDQGLFYFTVTRSGVNEQNSRAKIIYRVQAGDPGLDADTLFELIKSSASGGA